MLVPFLAALLASTAALCPKMFDLVRNGECYMQLDDARDYNAPNAPGQVKAQCDNYDALPVIIRDQEDHDYWVSVAVEDHKKGANNGFVILGLECNDKTEHWQWADGSSVSFSPDQFEQDLASKCDQNGQYCMWTINPSAKTWQKFCNVHQSLDVYCTVVPETSTVPSDEDCANFSHDDGDDVCYQIGKTSANWTEASTICHSFGASIASIHNDNENSFIRRLAVSNGLVDGLMLGGKWKDNSITWADGSPADYDKFAPGFPIDGLGECLGMETNNISGQWINYDCSVALPFACVKPADGPQPLCDGGLRSEGEIIYSPGFPSNSSEPCDFLLMVDEGMLVEVEILFLEANSCCDHLVLNEGSIGSNVIADLTGDRHNGAKYRTTSQNIMRASWQPHGAVNVKGMMITFRSVPK